MNFWGLSFIVINHCSDGLHSLVTVKFLPYLFNVGVQEVEVCNLVLSNLCLKIAQLITIGTLGQWQGLVLIESISRHLTAVFAKGGEQVNTDDYLTKFNFGETWTKVVHVYNFIPINYFSHELSWFSFYKNVFKSLCHKLGFLNPNLFKTKCHRP